MLGIAHAHDYGRIRTVDRPRPRPRLRPRQDPDGGSPTPTPTPTPTTDPDVGVGVGVGVGDPNVAPAAPYPVTPLSAELTTLPPAFDARSPFSNDDGMPSAMPSVRASATLLCATGMSPPVTGVPLAESMSDAA